MDAPNVLARVTAAGITLTPLSNGRIRAAPAVALNDELRALIRQHKPGLLAALADQPPIVPTVASTITPDHGGIFGPCAKLMSAPLSASPCGYSDQPAVTPSRTQRMILP